MSRRKSFIVVGFTYVVALIIGIALYFYLRKAGLDSLIAMLVADVAMTIIVFLASIVIDNSSVYDPYWSIIPIVIVIVWMIDIQFVNLYSIVIASGVLIWAFRLTRNWVIDFVGFSHEDFRYVDFRNKFGKLYWIISFLGIHLFPTVIVFVSLVPIHYVFITGVTNQVFVYLGFIVMASGALISYIADDQLRKHKSRNTGQSITTGIWKHSRHPNYFGEVFFWLGVFVVSLSVGFVVLNVLGFVAMLLLFNLYSVPKMESKLLKNKKDYQKIIDNIPRFFILPNSYNIQEEVEEKV